MLDIGANDLSPVGIGHLVEAITNHPSLTSLEVGQNAVGPSGIKNITSVAKFQIPNVSDVSDVVTYADHA